MSTNLRSKSKWKTPVTLLCVIAVCVLLNFLGSRLNSLLGLPFYFDNIGTILSALLGGYIPCITVGFLTNIVNGFFNPTSIYYCIISVFIATAAVAFADKLRRVRFPHVIYAVLTFAALGGIVGGVLTWLLFGLSFGEGVAVDFAASINNVIPMGYFSSNLLSAFLIDIVDKALTTVISLSIFKLLPDRLIKYLKTCSWYYIRLFEKSENNNRSRFSLRLKVTAVVAVSTTLVASAAIGTSILQYHRYMLTEFEEQGTIASELIAQKLDPDRIDDFLTQGRKAEGYAQAEEMLYNIRSASPDMKFIYVYRIEPDGTHVVFDLDSPDVEADNAGQVIEYDETIKKYKDEFLSGKDIPVDVTDDESGWLLSVYKPLKDRSGKVKCYIGVDMEMDRLRAEEFAYLTKIIALFIGFMIVIRTYSVWVAERQIVKPINSLVNVSRRSSYDTVEALKEWLQMLNALEIETGDEIETLYDEYVKAARNTVLYVEETRRKTEQLSKLQTGLILVLADMVESRDKCTGDHVFKTAAYTEIILRQMKKESIHSEKLTEQYISEVVNSAPLHDVGKITVSDVILNKPGKLTDEEFRIMQTHTVEGGRIIDKAMAIVDDDTGYLAEAKNLALYHHEKWNGKGYPMGLSGEEIPLSARVMAVADVFDALVSRRSYKEPFSVDKALDIIREDAGTHFDPDVARAFINAQDEVRRVAKLNMEP